MPVSDRLHEASAVERLEHESAELERELRVALDKRQLHAATWLLNAKRELLVRVKKETADGSR
jgi:hypothetical protein